MTVTDILKNSFPKNIDKTALFFSSIIANGKDAAIEKTLMDAQNYAQIYYKTPCVYDQTGEQLERTINHFSYLTRFDDESEKSWKNRFRALFCRKGSTTWGTPKNVRQVFQEYFPTASIFLLEGTNDISENLITEGEFENESGWDFETENVRSNLDSFSKLYSANLAEGYAKQSVTLENSMYFLHFFGIGDISLTIRDQENNYWDGESWISVPYTFVWHSNEWTNHNLRLKTTNSVVEFCFCKSSGFVDYIQLFKKNPWHSFTVIAQFTGGDTKGSLALAPGSSDNINTNSTGYGFYDQIFLTGVKTGFAQDIYQGLLKYVKNVGVAAYINIINKEILEED